MAGNDDDCDHYDRVENKELHHTREVGRREQQDLSRENEKLIKKLEILAKYVVARYSAENANYNRHNNCYATQSCTKMSRDSYPYKKLSVIHLLCSIPLPR